MPNWTEVTLQPEHKNVVDEMHLEGAGRKNSMDELQLEGNAS